jgi:predicted transposase YdaD
VLFLQDKINKMTVTEKYINPFTDFGFKKLFGTEPNKNLPNLEKRPTKLQEKVFERLFEAAEIAKFTPEEKEEYQESLKTYRDLKNVIDTSYDDGKKDGEIEGEIREKTKGIINALKRGKLTIEEIAEDFSTTVDFVLQVQKEQNL